MNRSRIRRLALGVGLPSLALAAVFWDGRVLEAIFPIGEVAPTDFAQILRRASGNDSLACPTDLCRAASDRATPVLPIPVERLAAAWRRTLAAQPSVTLMRSDPGQAQFDYVQRTRWMRYPDIVTVRFIGLDAGRSTLALYSRSVYGRGDMGVNRRRVDSWLERLSLEIGRDDTGL
jgi:Protein of unknown function (DUF1499)